VLVKLSKLLLVVMLSLSIGAHWAILQSVAWCGMAISYSQDSSIKEGLAKTFDGKHPCKLCKIVAEGKKSEKKQEAQLKIAKMELFSISQLQPLSIPPLTPGFFPTDSFPSNRTEAPLTPPPRIA
jgi:hypothetical protein